MPKISFLMSVYNGDQYLEETMISLVNQDYDDYDIIVVDDGSTDNSLAILDKFKSSKLIIHSQENQGLVASLNAGLQLLNCEYIARIDADDICLNNRLSRQLDFIEFTRADAISGRSVHIDEVGNPIDLAWVQELYDPDPTWVPAKEPYLAHPFLFARLNVLSQFGYRNAHLSEDADLCWRLNDRHRLAIQKAVLGFYRVHTNSISASSVTHGRIQAFYAQLSALNATKRGQGIAEIEYTGTLDIHKSIASSISNLVESYSDNLSSDEKLFLLAGASIKLLGLTQWRGYLIEEKDIRIAENAVRDYGKVTSNYLEEAHEVIKLAKQRLNSEKPSEESRFSKLFRSFK